jgi:rhodanese-related sulfurtransferase
MKKKHIIGVAVFLFLGAYIAFTGVKEYTMEETKPDKLFLDLIETTRYYSVEKVAELIISQDPSIQLIDVRPEEYYKKFSLNGAINIPIQDFLKPENLAYLDQNVYKTILISNGSSDADIAWMMATRMGYENVYVMLGGLNRWVEDILQPKDKSIIWDKVNDQLYQYRKGASIYFGGEAVGEDEAAERTKPKKQIIRRKKKEVEGGCG